MTIIRCIIAIAVSKHQVIHQLDINNALLHGDINEDVYMQIPEGLNQPSHMIYKLKKSLYGLKQASHQWFSKLTHSLLSQGFVQSKLDYSPFTHKHSSFITIVVVYVDDIIITGNNPYLISQPKQHSHTTFSIKDLGRLTYFLGLEASYSDNGIVLTQCNFDHDLLRDSPFYDLKPHVTPLPLNFKIFSLNSPPLSNPTVYRSIIGN